MYLDIETDLDPESLVWLIGVYTDGHEDVQYFFADTPGQEKAMLKSFLKFMESRPGSTIFHYSTTNFDKRYLKIRLQRNGLPVPEQLVESVDVGIQLERSIAMPTASHGLTDVANYVGYDFTYPDMDGREVARTYLNCIEDERPVPKKLFEYNQDDVLAVRQVAAWMEKTAEES